MIGECRVLGIADPGHIEQIAHLTKRSVGLPIGNDSFGEYRADPVEFLQCRRIGNVEIRSSAGSDGGSRRGHPDNDLFAINHRPSEIDARRNTLPHSPGRLHCIEHACTRSKSHDAGPSYSTYDIDIDPPC